MHPYIAGDLYDAISQSVTDGTCGAISISFIYCGESMSFFDGLDTLFAQAATQGQSVFIASGDWGAAGLQYDSANGTCVTGTMRNPSEMAASPHVTAVGGTTFAPQYNLGNDISVVGVAPGGIESGWDASGGGVSQIFLTKPSWQTGLGVPADDARDIPDVAMMAWAPYVFIGADNSGTAIIQCCWGGTSLSSPLWAGYSRVLAVASDNTRLGLLNPMIYNVANAGLPEDGGIEDVLSGNNTDNGVTGYAAGPGYDQITGLGSVDMGEFAAAFASGPHPTPTASSDGDCDEDGDSDSDCDRHIDRGSDSNRNGNCDRDQNRDGYADFNGNIHSDAHVDCNCKSDSHCDTDCNSNCNCIGDCHGDADVNCNLHGDGHVDRDCKSDRHCDKDCNSDCDCVGNIHGDWHGDRDCNRNRERDAERVGDFDGNFKSDRHCDTDCNSDCDFIGNCHGDTHVDCDCNRNRERDAERIGDFDGNFKSDRHCDPDCNSNCDRVGNCHGDIDSTPTRTATAPPRPPPPRRRLQPRRRPRPQRRRQPPAPRPIRW